MTCKNCGEETFNKKESIFLSTDIGDANLRLNFCNWNCLYFWLEKKMREEDFKLLKHISKSKKML